MATPFPRKTSGLLIRPAKPSYTTGTLSGNGALFTVGMGITLKLDNVTLKGHSGNIRALVQGTLKLRNGSAIKDNSNITNAVAGVPDGYGGGVEVWGGSTLDRAIICLTRKMRQARALHAADCASSFVSFVVRNHRRRGNTKKYSPLRAGSFFHS
ncbi:MAG: hypothetical protein LBB82_01235 [Treponema sp.]|jgi:hypothetical protein|nr:hypothetical protein [Treponema sp.]